jgi:ubiquinone/menaquinone biosynthesis C-methylase UbiE
LRKIDIGCGGTLKRCAKGYDVYTDVFEPREELPGKFVLCPAEKLPFGDKEFDYARMHHVIEHTNDPGKACEEMLRISKAGIISFPPAQAELMFGRKEHKWFVFVDRGRLLFVKKRHPSYGIPRKQTGCELNVNFEWEGVFKWLVKY